MFLLSSSSYSICPPPLSPTCDSSVVSSSIFPKFLSRASSVKTFSLLFPLEFSSSSFASHHTLYNYGCTYHTLLHLSPWSRCQTSQCWDYLIHSRTTGVLNSAWHKVSGHKILLKHKKRYVQDSVTFTDPSLYISTSSPKIKLMLCKVSLKSTPCFLTGSFRLINSWQNKLNSIQWPVDHSLQLSWYKEGVKVETNFILHWWNILQGAWKLGIRALHISLHCEISGTEKGHDENEFGRLYEYRNWLTTKSVATECPPHPILSTCVT